MVAPRSALGPLLHSSVDYAGLFPPAKLDMLPAMENYATYLRSSDRWLLGSFVLPFARVEEFEELLPKIQGRSGRRWSLSLILADSRAVRSARLRAFLDRAGDRFEIGSFEVAPIGSRSIPAAANQLSLDAPVFFECPVDDRLEARLRAIASAGVSAKIRTGGVEPSAFPSVVEVAHFIERCHHHLVPFKATAGLHHALRGPNPLTYEKGSPSAWMHGFFNVSLGAALVTSGKISGGELIELLSESAAEAFRVAGKEIRWRDRTAAREEIERARRSFLQSFGSCSFEEPLEELSMRGFV
ncbi:MAG: hypothetical protein AAGK22_27820 [Acidobacteriota bacterium]